MATVIRAARISSEQMTLPTQVGAGEPAQADALGQARVPPSPAPGQAPARSEHLLPPGESAPGQPVEDPANIRRAELELREQRLVERERLFQEQREGERRRVSEQARGEGFARGEQEAARTYAERLDSLQQLIASLKLEFAGEIAGLEDVVVGIVYEAVCKIIGDALHTPDGVRAVVRTVMGKVKDQEKLVLHLAPHDYDMLQQNRDQLFGAGQGIKHELVSDERVVLGGCLIETAGGTIDGRLEIQMQQLRETLIGARRMIPE